ncbi:zinc finger BED domain-containing protein RICESLEEPER 2, partial [Tanacetum coccineum]
VQHVYQSSVAMYHARLISFPILCLDLGSLVVNAKAVLLNIESELHTTRLGLFEEIEKRKTAEDNLAAMSTHWQRVGNILLSQTGFPLLAPSNDGSHMRIDVNAIKQFSEEVIVARFVSEAMGKAEAQAEAELAADNVESMGILPLKFSFEFDLILSGSYLEDNESKGVARRQRDRKRGLRKWLWSCIGMSIVIGASVIAYSYAPQHQLLENVVGDTQPDVGAAESESGSGANVDGKRWANFHVQSGLSSKISFRSKSPHGHGYLKCPMLSSVASESAFSTSGRLLTIRRTRLTPESLEMCMCLKDHLDAQERKQNTSPLELPLDVEEGVFNDEVQQNEATQLTDQEIALDASSDGSLSSGERRRDYMMSSGAEDDQTGEGGSMSHGYTYY